MRTPERVVAQVMNLGDYDDVQAVVVALGDEYLREILRKAEAGQFDERTPSAMPRMARPSCQGSW